PPPPPAAAPAAVPAKPGEGVTGILRRIGLTDHEIVVIGPGAEGPKTETVLSVTKDTVITRDGKKIALDGLKEGETATVKAKKDKDRLTAASIQVGEGAASPAAPAAQGAAPPRRNLIPRVRRALQMADELLRQMEERGPPEQPQRQRRPSDK
ncbi:MAG: hypothetical protein ACRELF_18745, partial [Gemmataceae bacterium]